MKINMSNRNMNDKSKLAIISKGDDFETPHWLRYGYLSLKWRRGPAKAAVCLVGALLSLQVAFAMQYSYAPYNEGKMDPQLTGWPLTDEERAYVLKPEHERRAGREVNQYKPAMWPVTPAAGYWTGTAWLDTHAKLVEYVKANQDPVDILLVGDSITEQWGSPLMNTSLNAAWQKNFGQYKTINIGIGGDKTQNVLWRLDHGGVDGLEPRLIILMIGNNNMFFTPETGIEPAACGIKACVDNLREKFPKAGLILVKVLPCHEPGNAFYEDIRKVNAALDPFNLEADAKVHILDIYEDFLNNDGTIKPELFTPDKVHPSQEAGYSLYAEKLKPLVDAVFAGKEIPKYVPKSPTKMAAVAPTRETPAASPSVQVNAQAPSGVVFHDVFCTPWFNNPFVATVNADNTAPTHGGNHSLAVTITGGGGCAQVNHPGSYFDTTPFKAFSFWINGGPTGGQKLHLSIQCDNNQLGPVWTIPDPKPNTWEKHVVPLSALGADHAANVMSVWFRDANTGNAQPTFYLDDIQFEGSSAEPAKPAKETSSAPSSSAAKTQPDSASAPAAATLDEALLKPTPKTADGKGLIYPYAPYNEGKMDPQLTGWPLTDAEKAWVAKGEYTRKPGHEVQKHLPEMWFVVPTAGRWGGDKENNAWVDHHATLIEQVKAAGDHIDIALLGDSITQYLGGGWDGVPFNAAWQKHFGQYKTVNLGLGGDRMENILWRLDHGALDEASPKVIVLMIGVNNAPLVFANGAPAASAARGIKLCVEDIRLRCPKSQIVLVKILPAFDPTKETGKAVVDINAVLDKLNLDRDPQVHVLDLGKDFTNADGTLKTGLYSDGSLHLGLAGYEMFASKLQPLVAELLRRQH
jgi:platelet-activating factor acetylhydrolase IB subunit beta/gamma